MDRHHVQHAASRSQPIAAESGLRLAASRHLAESGPLAAADLARLLRDSVTAIQALLADATHLVHQHVSIGGNVDRDFAEGVEQHVVHGLAWWATYAETLRCVSAWFDGLVSSGTATEADGLLAQILLAEYVAQLLGGLPMNQAEFIRPSHLGFDDDQVRRRFGGALLARLQKVSGPAVTARLVELLEQQGGRATLETTDLGETLDLVRDQFHAFAAQKISPFAHGWHLSDALIPDGLVAELAELGVFGLTIPERFGGAGMGKVAMCVVSEELSRGYLGVGSLPTRSEIAGELILSGGTDAQRGAWLPGIARGTILPTAVFTEPQAGSDLASLQTRATRDGPGYEVRGTKTWITHAARTDLMTLLVRTDPTCTGHRGLSMLLAPKARAVPGDMFPDEGLQGSEIPVIGYRGMREYELAFDGFRVDAANLLGGAEGQGFRQLMATFESARIQTAARAIGVAQCALDLGFAYARERRQFGRALTNFPRVHNKLAMMAAEIMAVRQLTYSAARSKDAGQRCDLIAGMAKLLGARVAWAAADNALQIHGGNGFAVESPISRVLADARILNIFEGAAEIQAQVIGRRLFDQRN